MPFIIAPINPLKDLRWDSFVEKHPEGSIYHSSVWIKLISDTFKYHSQSYALIDNVSGHLKGLLPLMSSSSSFRRKRLISLPYANYCDPLIPVEMLEGVLDRVIREFPGEPRIELRLRTNPEKLPHNMEKSSLYTHHIVDLRGDLDLVYKRLHKSCVKQKIKKANKVNLSFQFSKSEKELKEIYNLLLRLRKTKGLPPHPYKFFVNMWKMLSPKGMFFAPYVRDEDKMVSAAIILKYKDKIYYEYGASNPAYQQLGVNQYLLWETMKFGHEIGARFFDLGRSHLKNQSLIIFKDRMGGEVNTLTHCYLPVRLHKNTSKEVLRFFGESINKCLPKFILRLEGELVYRFFR